MFTRIPLFLPLAAVLLLTACGGGGSGGGSSSPEPASPKRFLVSASSTGGGSLDPVEQRVEEGQRATLSVIPDDGYKLDQISGCGGSLEGNQYRTAPVNADCEVVASFVFAGSVSGQLFPAPDTAIDGSINDLRAPLAANNHCAQAQTIDNRSTLHGFVSAEGTGGSSAEERFAAEGDQQDFYRVTLNTGQSVELEVADYDGGANNLELYLHENGCSRQIDADTSDSETKRVSTLLGGDSVIEVRAAEKATSKYVLRVTDAWSSQSASELEQLHQKLPPFLPRQVIIDFEPDVSPGVHQGLRDTLLNLEGLELAFRHLDTDRQTLAEIRAPVGLTRVPDVLEDLRVLSVEAFEAFNTLRIIDLLRRQPGVRFAEPNFRVEALRTNPNDPGYGNQWHYESIKLPEAWDSTTGEAANGESTVVAVVDTGVYLAHEDLTSKILSGHDFHDGDPDPDEKDGSSSWHGSHVAGTIAAATNNGTGVAGVSWAARILPVRVLGDGGGTRYNVIQGVRYAAGLSNDSGSVPDRPADIINLSLGGGGHSSSEQSLYHELRGNNIHVVAAAGNDGSDQPMYPAAYEGVVSVSATNCQNEPASYSNYGPSITLAAPGGDTINCSVLGTGRVLSTVGAGSGADRSSQYGGLMGTSMAAPHVAGVIALMRAVYPALSPHELDKLLAEGRLSDDLGSAGRDDQYGYGLLNAQKAVQAATDLRDNGGQWSARVVAYPATLYLGLSSEALFELREEGQGDAPPVAGLQPQDHWLAVAEESADAQGFGHYRVTIDRSSFQQEDAGNHDSEIVVSLEDGSELRIAVHIQVGFASQAAPVYVFLLDPQTEELAYQTAAEWTDSGELRYRFERIDAGSYLLVAGSDIDGNRIVCEAGELCGAYPDNQSREAITVSTANADDKDFPLDIFSRFRPFGGGGEDAGIRRE